MEDRRKETTPIFGVMSKSGPKQSCAVVAKLGGDVLVHHRLNSNCIHCRVTVDEHAKLLFGFEPFSLESGPGKIIAN